VKVHDNVQQWIEALGIEDRIVKEVLAPTVNASISDFEALATSTYMREAGLGAKDTPNPQSGEGTLRIVSSRLSRAVRGQRGPEGKEFTDQGPVARQMQVFWRRVITVPYANAHEEGGSWTVPATERMEGYFWAQFYDNGEQEKWKRLALWVRGISSFTVNVEARPYAGPALKDDEFKPQEIGRDNLIELLISLDPPDAVLRG